MAAPAERYRRFIGRDLKFRAAGIDQFERALDDERAVGTHADGDLGHGVFQGRGWKSVVRDEGCEFEREVVPSRTLPWPLPKRERRYCYTARSL